MRPRSANNLQRIVQQYIVDPDRIDLIPQRSQLFSVEHWRELRRGRLDAEIFQHPLFLLR